MTVAYRQSINCVLNGASVAFTVSLASLNVDFIGNTYTKQFHDLCEAYYTIHISPDNFAQLTALTQQTATDYWDYLSSANQDIVFGGMPAVVPEGLHDMIFRYELQGNQKLPSTDPERRGAWISTRIIRPPWNYEPDTLMHSMVSSATCCIDCPPGTQQTTVVTNVLCLPNGGLQQTFEIICATIPTDCGGSSSH